MSSHPQGIKPGAAQATFPKNGGMMNEFHEWGDPGSSLIRMSRSGRQALKKPVRSADFQTGVQARTA